MSKRLTIISAAALVIVSFLGAVSVAQTLPERRDAVIVTGKMAGAIAGKAIAGYRVMTARNGSWTVIPFQIDERDKDGKWCFTKGPEAKNDPDPAFDDNDDLVFMARDLGDKRGGLPNPAGCEPGAEIAVSNDSETAFAYLLHCSNPPALSPVKYVSFDPDTRTVTTDQYAFGWQIKDAFHYDYLVLNPREKSPDLLDRLEIRITTGKWGINITFHEDQFYHKFLGVITGPVRIIYMHYNKLDLSILGKVPLDQEDFFYQDWVFMHNLMDTGLNPALLGLDMDVQINHDLALDRSRGYKLCVREFPDCVPINGVMDENDIKYAKNPRDWGAVTGPEGTIITRFIMDSRMSTRSMGVYVDNDKHFPKPEYIPGSAPLMGFDVVDWQKVPLGTYNFDFYHYFTRDWSMKKLELFDLIHFHPLKVSVNQQY